MNRKRIKSILFLSLLIMSLVILAACGGSQKRPDLLDGFVRFEAKTFEIQYHSDWSSNYSEAYDVETVTFTTSDSRDAVVVMTQEVDVDLTQLKEEILGDIIDGFGLYEDEVNVERIALNGVDFYKFSYVLVGFGIEVETVEITGVKDGIMTTIALTNMSGREETREVFNQMIETFVFI